MRFALLIWCGKIISGPHVYEVPGIRLASTHKNKVWSFYLLKSHKNVYKRDAQGVASLTTVPRTPRCWRTPHAAKTNVVESQTQAKPSNRENNSTPSTSNTIFRGQRAVKQINHLMELIPLKILTAFFFLRHWKVFFTFAYLNTAVLANSMLVAP